MKTLHYKSATKEDTKTFVTVGSANNPKNNYTKDDFLTPGKVGEKFGISTDEAKTLMKKLKFRNASFILNGHMAQVVVDLGKRGCLYLHPMATNIFEQQLNKQKA